MTLVAWILLASVAVTDAAGHHPTKGIAKDGAEAIASACSTAPEAGRMMCSAVYLVQAFRESGYNLAAKGDCKDHITGKFYLPDEHGQCRPGDELVSFGPFQTGKSPKTWADAVALFTPLLQRSAIACVEPLAMVASGSCTNKAGIAISKARMAEARRIVAAVPFTPDGET